MNISAELAVPACHRVATQNRQRVERLRGLAIRRRAVDECAVLVCDTRTDGQIYTGHCLLLLSGRWQRRARAVVKTACGVTARAAPRLNDDREQQSVSAVRRSTHISSRCIAPLHATHCHLTSNHPRLRPSSVNFPKHSFFDSLFLT